MKFPPVESDGDPTGLWPDYYPVCNSVKNHYDMVCIKLVTVEADLIC